MVRCHLEGGERRSCPRAPLRARRRVRALAPPHGDEARPHGDRRGGLGLGAGDAGRAGTRTSTPEALQPVLRVRFEKPGPQGIVGAGRALLPGRDLPEAQEALLATSIRAAAGALEATPGYFVPGRAPGAARSTPTSSSAEPRAARRVPGGGMARPDPDRRRRRAKAGARSSAPRSPSPPSPARASRSPRSARGARVPACGPSTWPPCARPRWSARPRWAAPSTARPTCASSRAP